MMHRLTTVIYSATGGWSHTEIVGTLPTGVYDLTVNAFEGEFIFSSDTYLKTFEIVPEPMSIMLLGFGMLFLPHRKSIVNKNL